jgi:hypothetical protein
MSKKLLNYFYYILITIGLVYLLIAIILIYIGPITTLRVKHKLKHNPVDIVVSLTTTPYRIDTIKPVLDGIARQSIKPTRVYVNVPWRFKRDDTEYVIPAWLKAYPNIIINRTKDYGPATKLIATLEKEHDPKTIIITMDDDQVYPRYAVRDLVKQYLFDDYSENAAITGWGLNFIFFQDNDMYYRPVTLGNENSLIVIGTSVVAYKREFFKDDIFLLTDNLPKSCFLSDDLMISAYLLVNKINIIKASGIFYNPALIQLRKTLPSSSTSDALQNGANNSATGSNETNYVDCLEFLSNNNKSNYKKAILERSKRMLFISERKMLDMLVAHVYYKYYLPGMIRTIPFLRTIIMKTMG